MSDEAKKILSNPEDKKEYLKALEELKRRKAGGEVTPEIDITLSTGEEITLTTY
ncbi:hypothetical protein [Sphingobacterium sp. UBA5789]|nr:hypothetical protein [Sphingobacterium sp. UBA5789]